MNPSQTRSHAITQPARRRPAGALWLSAWLGLGLAGCGESDSHRHSEADHGALHVHIAPHGGTLIELGSHQANLELVRDASAGKLVAYILDGHAENFLRIAAPGFDLVAQIDGKAETLAFKPVASPATGEKAGDTSQFEAQADWLKTHASFEGAIPELPVRTTVFKDIKVSFPKAGH